MEISVKTTQKREMIDITDQIARHVSQKNGVLHMFVRHTTAAISTADMDPGGTDLDYLDAFDKIIPRLEYRHPHDPAHMPDHILATIIGPSLSVPVVDGKLQLGTWQRLVLIECDGPRERSVVITES
ncbi:MAG: secondary thiamine-phosphate synthase enzyme YjbQ [Candidatus Saccharibacteria bacterium]|nr:secondary thiamine-phosphate synthase enzyme YjbQ [Candidatus Saccharibacteria bacterium]